MQEEKKIITVFKENGFEKHTHTKQYCVLNALR